MKKWQKMLAIAAVVCLLAGMVGCGSKKENTIQAKHLLLNADGSYGGSASEELYGKGAPLNGEFDVNKSDYYTVNNDYYNMTSTEERIVVPHFASYQQTMQDSSGLACLLMVLNYAGQDVKGKYNELELLKRYETVNNTTVYENGTTPEGLTALVDDLGLGYTTEYGLLQLSGVSSADEMKAYFEDALKDGKFVFVRYQSPVGYGWKVVIGYDDLGNVKNTVTEEENDSFGDDVIIFAEPYDAGDHCQDGYATERARDFLVWWREMEANGIANETYSYFMVDPNIDIEYNYEPVDESVKQKLYDIHLPLNPDGTYGGTRDEEAYGSITSGRGWWNHTESNYYKISDFYNMGSEGTRTLLKNYTVLQQTMHSSCGICAVNSVLKYYGDERSQYDLELEYLNLYESVPSNSRVKGRGSSVTEHHLALKEWGYKSEYGRSTRGNEPLFPTYESYYKFMESNLKEGRPIVISTFMGSGHFLTIIGVDNMGTENIYDDVIITADSCDYWDGYQDGYNVFSANKCYRQHTNSKYSALYSNIVIYDKE